MGRKSYPRCWRHFAWAAVLCGAALSAPAFAETLVFLPAPLLTNLSPLGGQAGTTVKVTISGQDLDGASALVFDDASITNEVFSGASASAVTNAFLVHIPTNVRLGLHDVRVKGKFGISNPRGFCIGKLPETLLAAAGTSQDKATEVKINSVTNSECSAGAHSCFRIHVAAGQHVYVHAESPDTRLESQLALCDAAGSVLQQGRGDAVLDFSATGDADCFVELHDLLYRGGFDHRFRLVVSSDPPQPLGRPRTMASAFTDDAEIARVNDLARSGKREVPVDLALTPPCEFCSVFPAAGKTASFVFHAKKGDVFWVEVISHQLGHASDPALVLEKIEATKAAFIADAPDTDMSASAAGFNLDRRDGALRLEAKEDGAYRVKLRDLFNTAPSSPRLPYRLGIRRETPDFRLVAVPDQPPRQRPPTSAYVLPPTLRRGGVASLRIFVDRQDNFAGEIELKAQGLPPGVTCPGAILGAGDESTSLTFLADETATPWSGFVQVTGSASVEGKPATREARYGSPVWSVNDTRFDSFQCRLVNGIALAVIADDAPVLIDPQVSGVLEVKPNDKLKLDLKVTRRGGYNEPMKIIPEMLGEPDKSVAVQLDIPAKAETVTVEIDLARLNVKPGRHSFVLCGRADRVKYRKDSAKGAEPKDMTYVVWSKPIELLVKAEVKK